MGTAEAHAHLGALAAAAADAAAAQQHYGAAANAYATAMAQPHALGLFQPRCDVRCVGRRAMSWPGCCLPAFVGDSVRSGQQTEVDRPPPVQRDILLSGVSFSCTTQALSSRVDCVQVQLRMCSGAVWTAAGSRSFAAAAGGCRPAVGCRPGGRQGLCGSQAAAVVPAAACRVWSLVAWEVLAGGGQHVLANTVCYL